MRYALFLGCNIPARVPTYESSVRAVLSELGVKVPNVREFQPGPPEAAVSFDVSKVDLKDIREFACCGYPMRTTDRRSWLVAAARNMALAEKANLDMLVLCQCCLGSLKHAAHALAGDPKLLAAVNRRLAPHGLFYSGKTKITHLFSLLHDEIGVEAIKERVRIPLKGLVTASHTGCHALRPSRIMEFDDPLAPRILDDLIAATGAESAPYPEKLTCCGAPQTGGNDALAEKIMMRKIAGARKAGAVRLVTGCPWCQLQFEGVQERAAGGVEVLTPVLYPRLLGFAMGLFKEGQDLFSDKSCPYVPMPEEPAAAPAPAEKAPEKDDSQPAGEQNV